MHIACDYIKTNFKKIVTLPSQMWMDILNNNNNYGNNGFQFWHLTSNFKRAAKLITLIPVFIDLRRDEKQGRPRCNLDLECRELKERLVSVLFNSLTILQACYLISYI